MEKDVAKVILDLDNPYQKAIAESVEDLEKGDVIAFDEFFAEIDKEHGFKREI